MIERRKFAELGGADHGWLKAKSTLPMRCISTCGTTILTPYEVIDDRVPRRGVRAWLVITLSGGAGRFVSLPRRAS